MNAMTKFSQIVAITSEYLLTKGFSKKGIGFFKDMGTSVVLFEFSKGKYSCEYGVDYMLNIGIFPRNKILEKRYSRSSLNHYYNCPITTRPHLLDKKPDRWTTVSDNEESAHEYFDRELKKNLDRSIEWLATLNTVEGIITCFSDHRVFMEDINLQYRVRLSLLKEVDMERFGKVLKQLESDGETDILDFLKREPGLID